MVQQSKLKVVPRHFIPACFLLSMMQANAPALLAAPRLTPNIVSKCNENLLNEILDYEQSLFPPKSARKNSTQVSVRAWLWAWPASGDSASRWERGRRTSRSQSQSHPYMFCAFPTDCAFLPPDSSRKRETARSLTKSLTSTQEQIIWQRKFAPVRLFVSFVIKLLLKCLVDPSILFDLHADQKDLLHANKVE